MTVVNVLAVALVLNILSVIITLVREKKRRQYLEEMHQAYIKLSRENHHLRTEVYRLGVKCGEYDALRNFDARENGV